MKNNKKLIIGISLPLLVILFVIGAVVFPKLFFNPKYDFVYTIDPMCNDYNCRYYYNVPNPIYPYNVTDGKISKAEKLSPITIPDPNDYQKKVTVEAIYPKLYIYHVDKESFEEISLEQAQKLNLTNGGSDPDGTVVTNANNGSRGIVGEVLGGGSYYNRYDLYLKNGSFSKKITIENGGRQDYYYNSNFRLIGWVK